MENGPKKGIFTHDRCTLRLPDPDVVCNTEEPLGAACWSASFYSHTTWLCQLEVRDEKLDGHGCVRVSCPGSVRGEHDLGQHRALGRPRRRRRGQERPGGEERPGLPERRPYSRRLHERRFDGERFRRWFDGWRLYRWRLHWRWFHRRRFYGRWLDRRRLGHLCGKPAHRRRHVRSVHRLELLQPGGRLRGRLAGECAHHLPERVRVWRHRVRDEVHDRVAERGAEASNPLAVHEYVVRLAVRRRLERRRRLDRWRYRDLRGKPAHRRRGLRSVHRFELL